MVFPGFRKIERRWLRLVVGERSSKVQYVFGRLAAFGGVPNDQATVSGAEIGRGEVRAEHMFVGKPESQIACQPVIAGHYKLGTLRRLVKFSGELAERGVQHIAPPAPLGQKKSARSQWRNHDGHNQAEQENRLQARAF